MASKCGVIVSWYLGNAFMISTLAWSCGSLILFSALPFWWCAFTPQYDTMHLEMKLKVTFPVLSHIPQWNWIGWLARCLSHSCCMGSIWPFHATVASLANCCGHCHEYIVFIDTIPQLFVFSSFMLLFSLSPSHTIWTLSFLTLQNVPDGCLFPGSSAVVTKVDMVMHCNT